jgi:hypothetical protein
MEQKKMNMISTGAFLTEMDASNKQETLAEKFAAVWEKKNSKAARAGGVSLMALSLAACGSSSDDTAAVETPVVEEPVVEEPTTPVEPTPTVNTITKALLDFASGDTLAGTAGDDVLDLEINADLAATTTISGIETVNVTSYGATTINFTKITDVEKFVAADSTGAITLASVADAGMILGFSGSGTNNITAGYKAGTLSGASDTLNIDLSGAKAVNVAVDAGFEDIAINTGTSSGSAGQAAVAASDIDVLTVPGVTKMTITGEGAIDLADAVVNGVTSVDASGNSGAVTTGTANATTGFASGTITGATGASTILTGAGADNIGFTSASTTKTDSIKLGAGDDMVLLNAAGAGAVVVMGEGGDDHVRIVTSTVSAADVINGGDGDDTVTVAVGGANGLLLRDVENVTLTSAATGTQTFTADEAVAVTAKVNGNVVDVVNLSAGSSVTTAKATAASSAATDVTVDYLAVEAAATVTLGGGASGDITITDVADLTVTADDALAINNKTLKADDTDTTKLTLTLEEVTNGGTALAIEDISAVTDLTITASKAAEIGTVGASSAMEKMVTMSVTGEKAVTLGAIGKDSTATTMETLTVSGKGAVTVGELHDVTSLASYTVTSATAGTATADVSVEAIDETNKLATVTLSANRGAVDVNEIGATGVGTKAGTFSVTAYDEVDLNESVFWNNADGSSISLTSTNKGGIFKGAAATAAIVKNELGDISATLSTGGKAELALHAGSTGTNFGVATIDATAVTGGAAITVNNYGDTTVTTETSTVTLGAAGTGKTNAVTVDGVTDVMNITGGTGTDTVAFAGTDDHMTSGTINLAGGGSDKVDFTNITGALSATSEGVIINASNAAVVRDTGQTYSTSIAANTAAEFSDAGGTAKDVSTTDFSVVLSGVEQFVGTANADAFIAGNNGSTFTGKGGADDITLGAGTDTLIFTASNGLDTVSGFSVGTDGDVLDVSYHVTGSTLAATITNATGGATLGDETVVVAVVSGNIASKDYAGADFGDIFGAAKYITTTVAANDDDGIVIVKGNDVSHVYEVDASATTLTNAMVTQIAVLDTVGTWADGNIA